MTNPSDAPRQAPPAAWYRDRSDQNLLRYWDGTRWTEHTHPAPTQPRSVLAAERTAERSAAAGDEVQTPLTTRDSVVADQQTESNPGSQSEDPGSAVGATATHVERPPEPETPESDRTGGISAEIRQLATLRDEGILTAEEFAAQKKAMLAPSAVRVAETIEREGNKSRRHLVFLVVAVIVGGLTIWSQLTVQENSRQNAREDGCEWRQENIGPSYEC